MIKEQLVVLLTSSDRPPGQLGYIVGETSDSDAYEPHVLAAITDETDLMRTF